MSQVPNLPFAVATCGHPMWLRLFKLDSYEGPNDVEVQHGVPKPDFIIRLKPDRCNASWPRRISLTPAPVEACAERKYEHCERLLG